MHSIAIPSENCPYCRKEGSECQMMIGNVPMIREKESDFLKLINQYPKNSNIEPREVYIFQRFICLNK